jgi:hypothetical protein
MKPFLRKVSLIRLSTVGLLIATADAGSISGRVTRAATDGTYRFNALDPGTYRVRF